MDVLLEDFLGWLTTQRVREFGAPPATNTLVSYRMRMRGVIRTGELADSMELATTLSSRASWCALLDRLYARQAPVTVKGSVMTVRRFGEFAVARGLIDSHAVERKDGPKSVPGKPVVIYREDEVAKLLLYAKARGNLRLWMLLTTLAETGRRVGEMLNLTFDDLKLDADPPHIDLPRTKTRQCYVPLNRVLREEVWTEAHLATLKDEKREGRRRFHKDPAVYPFPSDYKTIQYHLHGLCEAAEIPYRAFHVLRHTRATVLIGRGVPIAAVSSLLGHGNVATTDRIYSHVNALDFTRYID
jgi:integrase/recombinase XerC